MILSEEEEITLRKAIEESPKPWIWVDLLTKEGPTALERYFQSLFHGDILHHWSPVTPEGYLEIQDEKGIVIHWVLGEENRIVSIEYLQNVDFDEIDESLSSTLIQNSVIRLFSEKF